MFFVKNKLSQYKYRKKTQKVSLIKSYFKKMYVLVVLLDHFMPKRLKKF